MSTLEINGMSIENYICNLIEKNDTNMIEIERGKLTVSALKQLNNHLRYQLDVVKFKAKQASIEADNVRLATIANKELNHGVAGKP